MTLRRDLFGSASPRLVLGDNLRSGSGASLSFGRGIVIATKVIRDDRGRKVGGYGYIDPEELRRAVLFWDRIAYPVSNRFGFSQSAETSFLKSAGVLFSPVVEQGGSYPSLSAIHDEMCRKTFIDLEATFAGQWSLADVADETLIRSEEFVANRGALVSLTRAIPLPTADVPLEDLLRFKEKHKAEIDSLNGELDAFFSAIVNAEDRAHRYRSSIRRIDAACAEMLKAARASPLQFRLAGLELSYSVPRAIATALATFATGVVDLTTVQELVQGASLSATVGMGLNRIEKSNPYRFVSTLHRDAI